MTKPDDSDYKFAEPLDVSHLHDRLPPLRERLGPFIRDVILPAYGLNIMRTAKAIGMDRAGLSRVLSGQHEISRDLAYRLGALTHDAVADLIIDAQHRHELEIEREKRESYRQTIERVPPPSSE